MPAHRNRYIKVALFEEVHTHLQDAKVVGQGTDYLLLERPQPKERKARAASATPRKPRVKANAKPALPDNARTNLPQVEVNG
jgi:hypothetical protein